jgi:predicted nucleic acid-binding protein
MTFVIDNSVVCGWLLAAQATPYSESIAERLLQGERATAPALLPLEYSNVLRSACRKGRLTAELAQQALADLAQLPIQIDTTPVNPANLRALALRFDLTSYDACYLDLALREQIPIATNDVDLAEAALRAGVGVVADR